jgi:hypothetical protein
MSIQGEPASVIMKGKGDEENQEQNEGKDAKQGYKSGMRKQNEEKRFQME